jgi:hypothetical protein
MRREIEDLGSGRSTEDLPSVERCNNSIFFAFRLSWYAPRLSGRSTEERGEMQYFVAFGLSWYAK